MNKYKIFLLGLVTGFLLMFIYAALYQSFIPTTVYVTMEDIVLENGSVISKGTKLTKEFLLFPLEWNELLRFGVSVESDKLKYYFDEEIDKRANLLISSPITPQKQGKRTIP